MRLSLSSAEILDRRYVMQRQLGKGGMGAVYEAYDRLSGQSVALKLVTTPPTQLDFASRSEGLNLYLAIAQEFKVLATLRHPNIISVINYGFDEQKRPYFTMDLLQDALSPARAVWGKDDKAKVRLLIQILQALAYLHRRKVIHRDLKPANVRVMNDVVRVLDFGLSIVKDRDKIESDRIVGTIEYMAPELLRQAPPTVETDLYAVGVMGYELFTGVYLFDSPDIRELAKQIFNKIPDPGPIKNPPVAAVLLRLMAKSPEDRYHSAEEAIAALSQAIDEPPPAESVAIRESFLQAAGLVGRDEELGRLDQDLSQTLKGRGGAWLIGGESGVGKSRLLEELRIRGLVQGVNVLRGEGVAQGRAAFQIWRDPLRTLVLSAKVSQTEAGILKTLIPDIDKLLEIKVTEPEDTDIQTAQRRLMNTILAIFGQVNQPTLIVLEDLHWAGPESFTLLKAVLKMCERLPILLIASYRDDETPDLPQHLPEMQFMKLERLEEREIEALVVEILGERGRSEGLFKLLKKETEGNIFFLIEILRALADEVGQLGGVATMKLPTHVFTGGVETIIRRRLEKLPEYVRPLLEYAALRGRQVDVKMLNFITGSSREVEEFLMLGGDAAVFEVLDGNWRFSHDKLREAIIRSLPREANRERHATIADAIENVYLSSQEHFSALAYHWALARNEGKESHYAALAGEQVLRNGAYEQAIAFLNRALELTSMHSDPELVKRRANLTRQLGGAYLGAGDYRTAKQLFNESLSLYRDVDYKWGMASALSDLGQTDYAMGQYEESYRSFRSGIEIAMSVRAQKVALTGVLGVAKLMYAAKRHEWAVELAAHIRDHVAVTHETAQEAEELLRQLEPNLNGEAFRASMAKGQQKTLREVVDELL